jgi:hypothetical protein
MRVLLPVDVQCTVTLRLKRLPAAAIGHRVGAHGRPPSAAASGSGVGRDGRPPRANPEPRERAKLVNAAAERIRRQAPASGGITVLEGRPVDLILKRRLTGSRPYRAGLTDEALSSRRFRVRSPAARRLTPDAVEIIRKDDRSRVRDVSN